MFLKTWHDCRNISLTSPPPSIDRSWW